MGDADDDRADALFHALSDRTRRDIMRRVLIREHSVTALAAKYDMSFAAVQKHVAVLEGSGLLTKRRRGREQLASGDVGAVRSVASMLDQLEDVWRGRIARIDALVADDPTGSEPYANNAHENNPHENNPHENHSYENHSYENNAHENHVPRNHPHRPEEA